METSKTVNEVHFLSFATTIATRNWTEGSNSHILPEVKCLATGLGLSLRVSKWGVLMALDKAESTSEEG